MPTWLLVVSFHLLNSTPPYYHKKTVHSAMSQQNPIVRARKQLIHEILHGTMGDPMAQTKIVNLTWNYTHPTTRETHRASLLHLSFTQTMP